MSPRECKDTIEVIINTNIVSPSTAAHFNRVAQQSNSIDLDKKFEFVRWSAYYMDHVDMSLEDKVDLQKALLGYCEDLAEKGHVTAMRYTCSFYSNGYQDRTVIRSDNNSARTKSNPDLKKALYWGEKAAAAGDSIAPKMVNSIKLELKDQPSSPKKTKAKPPKL
ncbi:MAG: hypothetical protein OXT65_01775 [Alphaproteobacteria bacterium]|nr:hypothetical protein [Alphaproteobacteria bacterium]